MAEHFGFFDAVQDTNGNYDREYNAEQFTIPFDALVTNGIVRNAYEQLEVVTSGSNMISRVKSGIAFIEGHHYLNNGIVELPHDVEVLGLSRIDRVVIRKDSSPESRYVKAFIKKGVPSVNPVPPTLTRNDYIYEISLAQVLVVGGQGFIGSIVDERGTVNIGPWAGSDILPSYDDNLLAQHVNNQDVHVTPQKKTLWDNAYNTSNNVYGRFPENCQVINDWNNVVKNGFYMAFDAPNAPLPNQWYMGIVIVHEANWIVQKVMEFATTTANNREFERRCIDGTWSPWFEISPMKLFQSVSNGKAAIANAITQKGAPTSPTAEFATMAANVLNLAGFATGTRTVGQGGALSVDGLTFEPKVVIGINQSTGKHLYFERLSVSAVGYVLSVHDYGLPDGVTGETQAIVKRRSAVTVTPTSISIPVNEAGTYTFYIYG